MAAETCVNAEPQQGIASAVVVEFRIALSQEYLLRPNHDAGATGGVSGADANGIRVVGMGQLVAGMRFRQMSGRRRFFIHGWLGLLLVPAFFSSSGRAAAQTSNEAAKKLTWHTLEFAIVRYNDNAPNSWNIYHSEKKGVLLVRLWKRYLLVNVQDQEVFDIDPEKIKVAGDTAEWSFADIPSQPIDTPDFVQRNVGTMERIRFRLGKGGHVLELQIPLGLNGRPIY